MKLAIATPTPERMAMVGGSYETAKEGPEKGRITLKDAPLDRLAARHVIAAHEHAAGVKYRLHWHGAGLQERYASLRMDGTFGGSGGTITDAMAHHSSQYRNVVQYLGVNASGVVEDICCREHTLEDVGRKLGWKNKPQAIAAATSLLKNALERAAGYWGIS